jgi:hypothetical protein
MLHLFDLHAESGRLALRKSDSGGYGGIELRTLQGQLLGEIPADFLPQEPHWSFNGLSIAFGSNEGLLYTYQPGDPKPAVVFANPSLNAGFCEWAADGSRLVFSAYDKLQGTPPNLYCLALDTGSVNQLTSGDKTVDRFPHCSPSGQWVAFQRQFLDEPEIPRHATLVSLSTGQCSPVLDPFEGDVDCGRFGWNLDSSALLVTLSQGDWRQLRVIRLQDRSTSWSYEAKTIQSGVFSPRGDRILCICRDELLWFTYPEGVLIQRLSLASGASVRHFFTGPQVRFDLSNNAAYFLGEDHCLYRWSIGGTYERIFEDDQPTRPAFTREEHRVTSRDGRPVPVQRFIPPEPRSVAILYIHGGPGDAIDPDDAFMGALLAEGIEFVCAAYRGSSGYGHEHEEANREEYGRADVMDILAAGFDWRERFGKNRPLIAAGYSYGGFLTFLALAQEEFPWAGGIAMWPVSDMSHMSLHLHKAFPEDAGQREAALVE